jgi:uncharacterized heparinase superfamily protein
LTSDMSGGSNTAPSQALRVMQNIASAFTAAAGRLAGAATLFSGFREPLPVLLPGSPDAARRLYSGEFGFAGQRIACHPASVFAAVPPSKAWADELHGFAWLTHLDAGGLALYRAFARSLFTIWTRRGETSSIDVTGLRLLSMARHGGFLLHGAPAEFETEFLGAVGNDVRRLAQARVRTPLAALRQSAAVLAAALSFHGPDQLREEALARTAGAAAAAILPDGGPLGRNPQVLAELLGLLVPLRERLESRRIAIPHPLNAAIERAMPMLRMLCHGDDGLAVFHGVAATAQPLVRALLARDAVVGRPLAHAAHSGYARLAQGNSTVIVDCGTGSTCDSPLALEFSDGPHRIVGSCGFPPQASPDWAAAARCAAAHSTLDIQNTPSRALDSFFLRRKHAGQPSAVSAELIASPHGTLVKARSGAHLAALGLIHFRELFLSVDGHDLRGEDRFERHDPMERGWPETDFALRFHLHPAVKVAAEARGSGVHLVLPSGVIWQFTARGGTLSLEDSVFLATGGAAERCRQIVIRGITGHPDIVNWAFRRL